MSDELQLTEDRLQAYSSTYVPLSLTIGTKLHDAELQSHLDELDTAQRLGENVSKLAIGTDVIDHHLAFFNLVAEEMISDVDMLAPVVVHRVLAQRNRGHVVNAQLHAQWSIVDQLPQQVAEPNSLA